MFLKHSKHIINTHSRNEVALSVLIYLPEGLVNTPESSVTQQCSNRERKADPIVFQTKASSPVQPGTWGAGQLELRQQTKCFTGSRAASLTASRQGI